MKLGLITDIHEHIEHLRTALNRFHEQQVDQIVMLGDVFELGHWIEETCRLLVESGVSSRHTETAAVVTAARLTLVFNSSKSSGLFAN